MCHHISAHRATTLFVTALIAAVTWTIPAPAQAAEPDVPIPIPTGRFQLVFTPKNPELVAKREGMLADRQVAVNEISGDRKTQPCPKQAKGAVMPLTERDKQAIPRCWNATDLSNVWRPQGITGTADASPDNLYNGIQAFAVTSYHPITDHARVTLLPNFAGQEYRHIRLVDAVAGGKSKPINCHAGGAVWYGNYLLVACTGTIAVFDWRKVYHPVGAPYEIIQVGSLDTKQKVQFSSLSLDRASNPPLLVVPEYHKECKGKGKRCRVIRFVLPIQPDDLPTRNSHKPIRAADAYRHFYGSTQGVISHGDAFWFASSGGPASNDPIGEHYGTLHSWRKGAEQARHYEWAYGAESITYWNRGDGTGEIVTVTEWPHYRVIAAVDIKHFP